MDSSKATPSRVRRTAWYSESVQPVRRGVYERKIDGLAIKQFWDGARWYSGFQGLWWNVDGHARPWRGVINASPKQ